MDRLHEDIGNEERIELIRSLPLAEVISAPGHRRLRNPGAVLEMSRRIAEGDLGPIGSELIILNVFTTSEPVPGVQIRSIECVDGNHRLAAALHADAWRVVGDIPLGLLEAWVKGWRAGGISPMPRWIPLEVAEQSGLDPTEWFRVPDSWGPKGPTAQISAAISATDPVIAPQHRGLAMRELVRLNLSPRAA
jgi:hypothetical protein